MGNEDGCYLVLFSVASTGINHHHAKTGSLLPISSGQLGKLHLLNKQINGFGPDILNKVAPFEFVLHPVVDRAENPLSTCTILGFIILIPICVL